MQCCCCCRLAQPHGSLAGCVLLNCGADNASGGYGCGAGGGVTATQDPHLRYPVMPPWSRCPSSRGATMLHIVHSVLTFQGKNVYVFSFHTVNGVLS